jgi:Uncharacterized protein conserved in bacteria
MLIVTRTRLRGFSSRHPEVKSLFDAWETAVASVQWAKFDDVKKTYNSVDFVKGEFLVFNVNSNRIVAHVKYKLPNSDGKSHGGTLFIRFVFTHDEYIAWSRGK